MQRQAMGVALHIVLLPFFELLHSTFDSYDADLDKSAFFLPLPVQLLPLGVHPDELEANMTWRLSDPIPTDPVPVPDPIPRPQPIPDPPLDPDPHPIIDPPPFGQG